MGLFMFIEGCYYLPPFEESIRMRKYRPKCLCKRWIRLWFFYQEHLYLYLSLL